MGDLAHSLDTLGHQDWIYLAEQAEKVGAWDLLTLNSLLQLSLQCLPYTQCISITLLIQTLCSKAFSLSPVFLKEELCLIYYCISSAKTLVFNMHPVDLGLRALINPWICILKD